MDKLCLIISPSENGFFFLANNKDISYDVLTMASSSSCRFTKIFCCENSSFFFLFMKSVLTADPTGYSLSNFVWFCLKCRSKLYFLATATVAEQMRHTGLRALLSVKRYFVSHSS
ncbi:hypothetical protein WA026_018489 [Henosepilachna vigintioctopunctata]|uniref:Uncharacterized protein n=1 Tax=Henosepilachna vigintioctopunctata TaxID=420089 RepID=A0AAW1V123_9CUCU